MSTVQCTGCRKTTTEDQLRDRLHAALTRCASVGLTGIHDASMELAAFLQLKQWDAAGELPLRIFAMADGQGAEADAWRAARSSPARSRSR